MKKLFLLMLLFLFFIISCKNNDQSNNFLEKEMVQNYKLFNKQYIKNIIGEWNDTPVIGGDRPESYKFFENGTFIFQYSMPDLAGSNKTYEAPKDVKGKYEIDIIKGIIILYKINENNLKKNDNDVEKLKITYIDKASFGNEQKYFMQIGNKRYWKPGYVKSE
jgi:hypothetical protein